ncbi:cyclin-dependent protein kinase inhibitor SMR2-like [Durio zibethinus]|uniref:Cyclin-dependent protein kinase inhibitor SMR2-like n=1 Tax=Durio zibethinus TaxID=66656 RepID=A0A6P5XQ34_DURZI|nr:cyclin-dependent protein kinase inhibitor SMR2-like [Durio zibethinus]
MSKDHHENILQESLQKLEQQQQQEQKEEEGGGHEKDGKGGGEEEEGASSRKDGEEECKTPTSSDHKIPTIQSCPPTPKKKVRVNSHKRKLSELQFFETTRSEEVESFFRSNSEPFTVESRSSKRRCRSA